MNLYVPPEYDRTEKSIIFLAGPILGAIRWQNEAAKLLCNLNPEINVASPRYIGEDERIIGDFFPEEKPYSQIDWETYHLNKAGKNGAILFWLAKESKHFCERAFAQTSRFELGEWKEKSMTRKANVVVGIEDSFSGKDYLEYRLSECPNMPVVSNLIDACKKAIELCQRA